MKSQMKSAFAFIAVALMIMVAVVPMVSLFTEENGVDAAIATSEYDNSVADPIEISGKLLQADGTTAITNSIVYATIASGIGQGVYFAYTNGSGEFSIEITQEDGTALGDIALTVEDEEIIMSAPDTYVYNGAYGLTFPTVTLKNVTGDESANIIAGSVLVSGKLELRGTATGVNVSTTISGAEGTVTSKVDGTFSFCGIVGKTYTLTASAVGTTFSYGTTGANTYTVKASGNTDIVLKAADYLLYGTTTVPSLTLGATSPVTEGEIKSVSSFGAVSYTTMTDGTYYYYAKVNYNTDSSTTAICASKFDVTFGTLATNGISSVENQQVPAFTRATGTTSITGQQDTNINLAPSNLITGSVAIGDTTYSVPLTATQISSVLLTGTYTDGSTTVTTTKTAILYGGKWFVGTGHSYTPTGGSATTVVLTVTKIAPTVSVTGYTFTPVTATGVIYSNNHVLVSGQVSYFEGMTAEIVYTATGGTALPASPAILKKSIGAVTEIKAYKFYVPAGSSVTVNAPTAVYGTYTPNVFTNANVQNAIVVPEFTYESNTVTYTGKITLNGVPIALTATDLAYSLDGGETFEEFTAYGLTFVTDPYSAAYKTFYFTLPAIYDAEDIFVKIAQDYTVGYKFDTTYMEPASSDAGDYYNFYGVEGTAVKDIAVKAEKIGVIVKDGNTSANLIEGQKVNFYMSGSSYSALTAVSVGSAVTDEYGQATIKVGKSITSDGYKFYAIPEGDAAVGTYKFGVTTGTAIDTSAVSTEIKSTSKTTSGMVINTSGAIVAEPKISYVAYAGDAIYGQGQAKIVDQRYYIVTDEDVTKVVAKIDGYTIDGAKSVTIDVGSIVKDIADVATVTPAVTTYSVAKSGIYSDKISVVTGSTYVKGDVITLSAISEYTVEDSNNIYSDGYTKYTFKAWYVNGKQVSTDAVTSYTIGDEDIIVSADYAVEHVSVADGKQSEKGVDSTVLVIGIAAVVIALIAVIYAVIQRKN